MRRESSDLSIVQFAVRGVWRICARRFDLTGQCVTATLPICKRGGDRICCSLRFCSKDTDAAKTDGWAEVPLGKVAIEAGKYIATSRYQRSTGNGRAIRSRTGQKTSGASPTRVVLVPRALGAKYFVSLQTLSQVIGDHD
jgi:hypothetical protein